MAMMEAPSSGVTVRMYRQGHGDCFLLAFPRKSRRSDRPVFMLIDCGLKRKSEVDPDLTIDRIIDDIADATGGRIDVVVITHEHEDHVNGFAADDADGRGKAFDRIEFGKVWLAWTEDGDDDVANGLRQRFNDTLIALTGAQHRMAASEPGSDRMARVSELLDTELGGDVISMALDKTERGFGFGEALGMALSGATNKNAMRYVRDKAEHGVAFLRPDEGPYDIPDGDGPRVFALGPPRNPDLLESLNPHKHEEFKLRPSFGLDGAAQALKHAMIDDGGPGSARSPFALRHCIEEEKVWEAEPREALLDDIDPEWPEGVTDVEALRTLYGPKPGDADFDGWRRIEGVMEDQAEALALRLNKEVNNTSVVMAIELPRSRKVLLFTGDAQRGNWISWKDLSWEVDGETVDTRDLLSRTVLYKAGHHGSHNATLNGTVHDEHPNLSWMARDDRSDEFVAMIPANTRWAEAKKPYPWKHPLKAIETALTEKAEGRVFRSDLDAVERPEGVPARRWRTFEKNTTITPLYFEYTIFDR